MKKGIFVSLLVGILSFGSIAFAYTPSTELESKLEVVATKIESIIESKGESYRTNFITALEKYKVKYSGDERASYIISYLVASITKSNISEITSITNNISSDYTGEYTINDSTYGTEVAVTIDGDKRIIVANALPNHITGEFPRLGNPNTISAQEKTFTLDYTPTYVGSSKWTRESGVAYNGVKFELETAERVECESGEVYKIEAIQDDVNLGLDMNHAHVQPTGEYHYHGVADNLIQGLSGDDIVHIGYANDGFPLYYSKQKTFTPSYALKIGTREGTSCTYRNKSVDVEGTSKDGTYVSDREFIEGKGNLDSCNGGLVDGEYAYFITEDYPYGPRCLNGEFSMSGPGGGQGGPEGGQGGPRGGRMGPPSRQ